MDKVQLLDRLDSFGDQFEPDGTPEIDQSLDDCLIDGILDDMGDTVLQMRRLPSDEGFVLVAVTVDGSGHVVAGPRVATEGWIDACGFSGHGIMHAPATGVAVAEMIADGQTTTVDVDHFELTDLDEDGTAERALGDRIELDIDDAERSARQRVLGPGRS